MTLTHLWAIMPTSRRSLGNISRLNQRFPACNRSHVVVMSLSCRLGMTKTTRLINLPKETNALPILAMFHLRIVKFYPLPRSFSLGKSQPGKTLSGGK